MELSARFRPGRGLTARQKDFLQLTAFVLAQHGRYAQADVLLSALSACGGATLPVLLARAVLRYHLGDHRQALGLLEEIDVGDPIERFGMQDLTERQKLRRYLKARCYRELGKETKASDAVDIYLRRMKAV
jgi:hypothetical protein